MCINVLPKYMFHALHVCSVQGDQKSALGPLDLKMAVSCQVGRENWTQVLCNSHKCSLRFIYLFYTSALSLSSDTPEEGIGSQYRWLWATMWLLGFELRTYRRAVSALTHWAISPAPGDSLLRRRKAFLNMHMARTGNGPSRHLLHELCSWTCPCSWRVPPSFLLWFCLPIQTLSAFLLFLLR